MDPYYTDSSNVQYKRSDIFKIGNYGFNLLFEGGCGLLIKINNTICVHGRLTNKPYSYFDECNQFIMTNRNNKEWGDHPLLKHFFYDTTKIYSNDDRFSPLRAKLTEGQKTDFIISPLWDRINDDQNIDLRNRNKQDSHGFTQETYCIDRKNDLKIFFSDLPNPSGTPIETLVENARIVVGHCNQNESSYFDEINSTFETHIESDDVSNTFGTTIYTGKPKYDKNDQTKNVVFGISMECIKPNISDAYVYHVDIASSRAFDQGSVNKHITNLLKGTPREAEQRYYGSRTPQVLVINRNMDNTETINIVKSKLKNTRKFLRRNIYEQYISNNNIKELLYDDPDNADYYEKKYLKYKNKYLNLKYKNKYINLKNKF